MFSQRHFLKWNHCLSTWYSTGKVLKGNLSISLCEEQTALKGRPERGNKLLHGATARLPDLVAILLYYIVGITQITTENSSMIKNAFRSPRLILFFPKDLTFLWLFILYANLHTWKAHDSSKSKPLTQVLALALNKTLGNI